MTDSKQANPIQVPGSYGSSFFPRPMLEAISLLTSQQKYTEKKLKKVGGATVFKAHPGFPTILLCNNVSAEFLFKAPDDLVERETAQIFGFVAPQQKLLKHGQTAILTSGELHTRSRALIDEVIRIRADQMIYTFERTCIAGFKEWPALGKVPIEEGFQKLTATFAFQWLLGVTPNVDDVIDWQKKILIPVTDSGLSNVIIRLLPPFRVPGKSVATADSLTELVRSSPLFDAYMDLARKQGFDDEDNVARQFVFVCAFNISGGISRFLLPTMASVSIYSQVRARLVSELDSWDPEKTSINELPYLDAVLFECMRLCPWPRFIHKKAHRDFVLPAENGLRYQIHKGDLLMSHTPYVHRDPTVFKDDPLAFKPERFIEDPGLKDKVFTFGWARNQAQTYGCAGRFYATHLLKLIVGHLCKYYTWQVRGANINLNNTIDVSPDGVACEDFKVR